MRFLTYNTYLLQALIQFPIILPDISVKAKPALHERAHEIGQIIANEYDLASLYEVMQEEQRDEILAAWGSSPPESFYGGTLSSLLTVSTAFPIGRRETKTYKSKGKATAVELIPVIGPTVDVSLDSDFYARKGVMMTELITPHGTVEVFSTHLMFGGGLGAAVETVINAVTPFERHIAESNPDERFSTQMEQIEELIEFYKQHHHANNVAILCGDLNIDGSDPNRFGPLQSRLAAIGMKDWWAHGPFENNLIGGQTSRNDDDDSKPREADFNNICTNLPGTVELCDDTLAPGYPPPVDCAGRFDYIFVEEPQSSHDCILDLTRIRRREFRRSTETEGQMFLSDHLGLETTLLVSRTS